MKLPLIVDIQDAARAAKIYIHCFNISRELTDPVRSFTGNNIFHACKQFRDHFKPTLDSFTTDWLNKRITFLQPLQIELSYFPLQ